MTSEPEYYQDHRGQWRWHVRAANNEIVAAASESFASKQKAQENYRIAAQKGKSDD